MIKRIQFIVFMVIMVIATSGYCQIRPGAFSVSPFVGGFWFEGNQDLDHRPVYGLKLGYDFTKNIGAEATFDYVNTHYTTADINTNVYNYRVEALYHFMPDSKLVPFIAVGVGGMSIDYKDATHDKDRATFDYGLGLKYFLTDWLALRADVRHVLAFGSVYNNLEYTAGLVFYFGGKKEGVQEMKKEPEAEAKVEPKIIEKGRVTLNVQFDTGKAIVKPAYYKEIEEVTDVMKKYLDLKIVVEGHTDNVGGEKYNLNLSQKRAEAIKTVMVDNFKIESTRIKAKGFGYSKSIGDNLTIEGRKSNRRVEAAVEYVIEK
jgi:OOP family OmpA-OmpF porin